MENRAIISVHSKLPKRERVSPNSYLGVTELVGHGFVLCEVALPFGVTDLPQCPFMFTADCETTYAEFRKGKMPLLTVNDWREIQHYYM